MRDSEAVFGLSRMCQGQQGLDDLDDADFQLQDGNKVKELAILFKMTEGQAGGRSQASSPADSTRSPTGSSASPTAQPKARGPAVKEEPPQQQEERVNEKQVAEPTSGKQQAKQAQAQRRQPGRPSSIPAAGPSSNAGAVASRRGPVVASPTKRGNAGPPPMAALPAKGKVAARSRPGAGSGRATAAAPAANKPAAPAARPSLLRQPSSSSSYFTNTVSDTKPLGRVGAAAGAIPSRASGSSSSRLRTREAGSPGNSVAWTGPAVSSTSACPAAAVAAGPRAVPARATTNSQVPTLAASDAATDGPAKSRLTRVASRIPTPGKPAATHQEHAAAASSPAAAREALSDGAAGSRLRTALMASSRLRPAVSCAAERPREGVLQAAAHQAEAAGSSFSSSVPALRIEAAQPKSAASSEPTTPNTARLRFLEEVGGVECSLGGWVGHAAPSLGAYTACTGGASC